MVTAGLVVSVVALVIAAYGLFMTMTVSQAAEAMDRRLKKIEKDSNRSEGS